MEIITEDGNFVYILFQLFSVNFVRYSVYEIIMYLIIPHLDLRKCQATKLKRERKKHDLFLPFLSCINSRLCSSSMNTHPLYLP